MTIDNDHTPLDQPLGEVFRAATFPATPELAPAMDRALARRAGRRRRRAALSLAAAVLLVAMLAWQPWSARRADMARQPMDDGPPPELFAPPPVERFDVLADQQAAYVAVLEQLGDPPR